jgi:glycerophosphoryl diester phosphodiesterase
MAAHVPFLEVDVRLSDEGDLFLFHDGSLNRFNSYAPSRLRGRPIQSLTRNEREEVFLDPDKTMRIPLFEQALNAVKTSNSNLQVDLKGESDRLTFAVLEQVAKGGMLNRVVVQVRSSDRVALIRARYPAARVSARCLSMAQLDAALARNVEFVELERWISPEAMDKAHRKNTKVTVNIAESRLDEPATWEYLRSRGVDVLMSNAADRHSCK